MISETKKSKSRGKLMNLEFLAVVSSAAKQRGLLGYNLGPGEKSFYNICKYVKL